MTFSEAIPAFPVFAIEDSTSFYQARLGFQVLHEDKAFAVLKRGDVMLHLWASNDTSWKGRWRDNPIVSGAESFLKGTASCRIAVQDIEGIFQEMKATKVLHPNAKTISQTSWGTEEFAVLDLDGNLITFFQGIKEAA